jgi:FtsZ-interacting cell division protein ZipA
MLKAIIIIVLVVGVLVGGLLTLRRTGRAGMPDDAVLQRAAKRAREQAAAEDAAKKSEDGRPPK